MTDSEVKRLKAFAKWLEVRYRVCRMSQSARLKKSTEVIQDDVDMEIAAWNTCADKEQGE